MTKRKQNSTIGAVLGGAAVGGVVGFGLGYSKAVPDIEKKLEEVEKLIDDGKPKEASDLLVEALDDVGAVHNRMGGSAASIRKRMEDINKKLPPKWQLFVLQTKKLKAKLLR